MERMLKMKTRHVLLAAGAVFLLALGASMSACQSSGPLQATPADSSLLTLTATMSQPLGGLPTLSVALVDLPEPLRNASSLTLLAGGVTASGMRNAAAMDFTLNEGLPAVDARSKLRGLLAADAKTVRRAELTLVRP